MSLLEVDRLSKRFGGLVAVNAVTFKVDDGQIKAVIGPNGAGKTTLFNVLTGVEYPDAGRVRFQGSDITHASPRRVALRGIGRTFQSSHLFENMTVLENVMVGCHGWTYHGVGSAGLRAPWFNMEERRIRAYSEQMLRRVGIEELAGKPAAALPHGQRRLVEIARALAARPVLLLLDEPAAGLSTAETGDLQQTLYRIRDLGITIVLIEHDMSLVMEVSDDVVVLNYGEKIAEGPPHLIRQDEQVIAAYLGEYAGRQESM